MSSRRAAGAAAGPLVIALAAAAALVVVPLVRLVRVVSEDGGSSVGRVLREPGLATAAVHSVVIACAVTLIAVPVGTVIALGLNRTDVPCRGLLKILVVLPLVIPQFVLGYSWHQAYARAGFTDSLLHVRWAGLDGPVGIVVVLVVDAVPLCYLLSAAALATRGQPDLVWAARLSGADPWTAVRTVTLPLLRPMIAAATVLTFVSTMESFAVPQVLGAPTGFSTLTTRIYADLSLGSTPEAFLDSVTLSLGLLVLVAVVLIPADVVLAPRLTASRTGASSAGPAAHDVPGGRGAVIAASLGAYGALAVGVPCLALLSAAVTRAVGLRPTPSNWTLDNFRTALDAPTVHAIGNSLTLAGLAATLLTLLGALLVPAGRRRGGSTVGVLAILTFAVPGSTLAVGLLIAYGHWFGGSLALILIAYLAKFWAIASRTISGAADRVPTSEWQAARTSGAGPLVAAVRIWLPALAPALLGAWVLVFVGALHEVTMSSLLYSFGNETLAVAVLNSQQLGDVRTTAALAVVLTALLLLAAVPAWFALRLRRSRARRVPTRTLAVTSRPPELVMADGS